MFAKIHESESEVVLAACDEEFLGKRLKNGKTEFYVNERFYSKNKVTREELGEMLDKCTIANLVGQKVINVAKEKKVIEDKHIMRIGGVPHAQMARMRS
jgi:hypothetical protein